MNQIKKYNAQEIADLLNSIDDTQHMCALDFSEKDCEAFNTLVAEIVRRNDLDRGFVGFTVELA